MRASLRFTEYDKAAALLDQQFDALGIAQQDEWNAAARRFYWWWLCPFWQFPPYYGSEFATGMEAFRTINLARKAQGLLTTEEVPAVSVYPDNDALDVGTFNDATPATYPLLTHFVVAWRRDSDVPAGSSVVMLWARARVTRPNAVRQAHKYTFIGSAPIERNTFVPIDELLLAHPVVLPGGLVSIYGGCCDVGTTPMFYSGNVGRNV